METKMLQLLFGYKVVLVVLVLEGMILENGPVLIKQDSTLYNNPYGWNKQMHLLYVDNPVGAGYSYVEKENGYPTDEVWMANELYTALSVFFSKYQKYSTNDFYIFGESYAGKYIPAISYKIYEEGNKINLKGFSIGDGLTDPLSQIPHFSDYAYATGLIDINQKAQIVEIENKALAAIKNKEYTKGQDLFYQAVNTIVGWAGGVNEYDIRDYQGYDFGVATEYFNSTAAKKNFGANVDWNFCSDPAQDALLADFSKTVKPLVDVLVQQGYKVLLYNGQFDLIVNLLGAEDWIKNINWAGKTNFNNADRKIWKVDDNVAGYVKNYENLTYIMLLASGHLAPMNQPKNTYDMISRFVNDKPFAN
ncbi:serine carboxypeptidase-like 48-related [Anaeramoeba flamelloides]|uniref:Carboxypeptidase n=1 Tax=Anaeramoeba flamelloides TaxID=1746091 RepID=A0AAV7Y5U1_9EUKA|nr:serine carboxypeptidase-like 48-related [Anaeramoeba flamelloides]KAJ6227488.1 serine carboxypeptidase-like 48-related [Anaeramoeba flamelloides]